MHKMKRIIILSIAGLCALSCFATDPEGKKNGWNCDPDDVENRDLKFFDAVAPSASAAGKSISKLKPKPVLHVAGETDGLVEYAWQKRTINKVRSLNHCAEKGESWASAGDLVGTLYPSKSDSPLVTLIHPGQHRFPKDAPPLIARFFKENCRKPPPGTLK
jgi:polyhydroxybutyrate depolymerase